MSLSLQTHSLYLPCYSARIRENVVDYSTRYDTALSLQDVNDPSVRVAELKKLKQDLKRHDQGCAGLV